MQKQNGTCTQRDKTSRLENSEVIPHHYSHLIFNKGSKTHIGEKTASSTMVLGKWDIHT
jgi:hypothetical protein